MEEQKGKRVLNIELDNDVKKVSITGKNGDEKVVMRQELSEDDLNQATGGGDKTPLVYPYYYNEPPEFGEDFGKISPPYDQHKGSN